jgi:PTS system nitrogen regulatory IIA component
MDGQPAHLFFLLIAPEDSSGIHLQVLARIAKILKNRAFRMKLMEPSTRKELYQTIIETDEQA